MNDKPMNIDRDTKLIRRYLNISKPAGVSDIEFELRYLGDDNEYYMRITYVVPHDSKYLKVNPDNNSIPIRYRYEWNHQISKDIKDYFGIKVYINNSGTRSEKFNYGE
jgi:lipopolysaccharide assembly outer membrane protein LptD (OstA)